VDAFLPDGGSFCDCQPVIAAPDLDFMLQEHIPLGQRIAAHEIQVWSGNNWLTIAKGTTIGQKRIHRLGECTAQKIRVMITESKACPLLSSIGIYKASPRDITPVAAPVAE